MAVDHVTNESVRIDSDSVSYESSTKGVITFGVKRYTDFTVGVSSMAILDDPAFWEKVVAGGQKAKKAFYAVNPELK